MYFIKIKNKLSKIHDKDHAIFLCNVLKETVYKKNKQLTNRKNCVIIEGSEYEVLKIIF